MIAVSTVRDEADIVGFTVAHLLAQGVERVAVIDNGSVDGTGPLLAELAAADSRLTVRYDPEPAHYQGRRVTDLAAELATPGEWVVPFDADELWSGLDTLEDNPADVIQGRPYVHVPHAGDDPTDVNPCTRIVRRQAHPEPQCKLAFRWQPGAVIDEGAHRLRGAGPVHADGLDVRHFQYRTLNQVARKVRQGAAALRATTFPEMVGSHWRQMAAMSDDELAEWWAGYLATDTIHDPAPYRCRP